MPNHVITAITVDIDPKTAFQSLVNEEGKADFNKVVPMPPEVAYTQGKALSTEDMQGPNWYDWCTDEWGTKWGAYTNEWIGEDILTFETAWAHPEPVMKKWISHVLTENPKAKITVAYADEDLSYNCGMYNAYIDDNGETVVEEEDVESGSFTAQEFASVLKYKRHYNDMISDFTSGMEEEEIEDSGYVEVSPEVIEKVRTMFQRNNLEALLPD